MSRAQNTASVRACRERGVPSRTCSAPGTRLRHAVDETPEASMRARIVDGAMSKRAVSPTRLPAAGVRRPPGRRVDVEPDAARAGDVVRARRRDVERPRCQLPRDRGGVAGRPSRRVALISSAAAPATCGALADVPTIAMPGQTSVEAGATTRA